MNHVGSGPIFLYLWPQVYETVFAFQSFGGIQVWRKRWWTLVDFYPFLLIVLTISHYAFWGIVFYHQKTWVSLSLLWVISFLKRWLPSLICLCFCCWVLLEPVWSLWPCFLFHLHSFRVPTHFLYIHYIHSVHSFSVPTHLLSTFWKLFLSAFHRNGTFQLFYPILQSS